MAIVGLVAVPPMTASESGGITNTASIAEAPSAQSPWSESGPQATAKGNGGPDGGWI
jgi:hypothetical protein